MLNYLIMIKVKNNECRWCKYLTCNLHCKEGEYKYRCNKTAYDNLRGFPFKRTKCKKFEKNNTFNNL